MTAPARETATAPAARPAEIDRRLARATAGLCRDHPRLAPAVRGVLAPLRDRLHRVHSSSQQADAPTWAVYTAELDRGVDELTVEIARAAERQATGAEVDDVLTGAAARLELRAWQLRLGTLTEAGADTAEAQALADALVRRLADAAPVTRDEVDHALADLRAAVRRVERG